MGSFSCMPFKSPNESLSSTIKEACSRQYVEDVNFVERGFVVLSDAKEDQAKLLVRYYSLISF